MTIGECLRRIGDVFRKYVTNQCPACGGSFEFLAKEIGREWVCPHCQEPVVLKSVFDNYIASHGSLNGTRFETADDELHYRFGWKAGAHDSPLDQMRADKILAYASTALRLAGSKTYEIDELRLARALYRDSFHTHPTIRAKSEREARLSAEDLATETIVNFFRLLLGDPKAEEIVAAAEYDVYASTLWRPPGTKETQPEAVKVTPRALKWFWTGYFDGRHERNTLTTNWVSYMQRRTARANARAEDSGDLYDNIGMV